MPSRRAATKLASCMQVEMWKERRKKKTEQLEKMEDEDKQKVYTFQPQLNETSRELASAGMAVKKSIPVHERLHSEGRTSNRCSDPPVCAKKHLPLVVESTACMVAGHQRARVCKHLCGWPVRTQLTEIEIRRMQEEEFAKNCTFKPTLSKASQAIVKRMVRDQGYMQPLNNKPTVPQQAVYMFFEDVCFSSLLCECLRTMS
jgi:hypothetical protein